MVGPAYVLRNHEVLLALHPWGATLGSEGVRVVTDIDTVNPWVGMLAALAKVAIVRETMEFIFYSVCKSQLEYLINSQLMLPFISSPHIAL